MPTPTAGTPGRNDIVSGCRGGRSAPWPDRSGKEKARKNMPERNVDKIKRLERELAGCRREAEEAKRLREKVTAANQEIASQREIARKARKGVHEVVQSCDALCIAVGLKLGVQVGPEAWELDLPMPQVAELLGKYRLMASEAPEAGGFRLRVEKRGSTDGESV